MKALAELRGRANLQNLISKVKQNEKGRAVELVLLCYKDIGYCAVVRARFAKDGVKPVQLSVPLVPIWT